MYIVIETSTIIENTNLSKQQQDWSHIWSYQSLDNFTGFGSQADKCDEVICTCHYESDAKKIVNSLNRN